MPLFTPDRYFSHISHIDIQRDLLACGLKYVFLDIDNTILPRDTRELPRDVGFWMGRARDAGVTLCLVSNSMQQDVYEFARRMDVPIVAKAYKPLPFGLMRAVREVGGDRAESVMVGDQLVTDVWGAHVLGMKAYLLRPLVQQDLKHTVIFRAVENAFLGDRQPEGAAGAAQVERRYAEADPYVLARGLKGAGGIKRDGCFSSSEDSSDGALFAEVAVESSKG